MATRTAGNSQRARNKGDSSTIGKYMIGKEYTVAETSFGNTKEKGSVMKEEQGEMEKIMERMLEKFMRENEKLRNKIKEERNAWMEKRMKERERREREKIEWDRVKKDLKERIKELELKEKRREKKMRRSNIVIRGVQWNRKQRKRFLKEYLKMEIEVVETRRKRGKKI